VVKDIASKEIVGWSVSSHIDMDLVLNTLSNMKNNLNMISFKDILIHSDQGVHYTNPLYINSLKDLNMIQSMSKKGNCLDNAPIESFFGHLKDELDYKKCKTIEELRSSIADYINYYNNKRRQWDIQKMTPVMYRDHLLSLVD
jgi:transposase InsO family protein